MNIQCNPSFEPLRVLIVNPLLPCAYLLLRKMLTGEIFGKNQKVNLSILIGSTEELLAQSLKIRLEQSAFDCLNEFTISHDLPRFTDADVFCFLTNLLNPNRIDFNNLTNEEFDSLYTIIKIVKHFDCDEKHNEAIKNKKEVTESAKPKTIGKAIFLVDGLIALSVIKSISKCIPSDILFCPTLLDGMAKSVLGAHIKVPCHKISKPLVWAANDEVFYIEFENPLIMGDKSNETTDGWQKINKNLLTSLNKDHVEFNENWLKKDLIEKVQTMATKNPFGPITKSTMMVNALRSIWSARHLENKAKVNTSLGIISDGSYETIKGLPYVLPLELYGTSWKVNKNYTNDSVVKLEIVRMNRTSKLFYAKLDEFCKRFMEGNIFFSGQISESGTNYEKIRSSRSIKCVELGKSDSFNLSLSLKSYCLRRIHLRKHILCAEKRRFPYKVCDSCNLNFRERYMLTIPRFKLSKVNNSFMDGCVSFYNKTFKEIVESTNDKI